MNKDQFKIDYPDLINVKNLIYNKSVAIVGNAQSIFDYEYGNIIDSYDIVCRFNKGKILNPNNQGSKTDIWMVADPSFLNLNIFSKAKIKIVRVFNRNMFNVGLYKNCFANNDRVTKELRKLLNNTNPSSGFCMIDICIKALCQLPIGIFGFDGLSSPTFYNSPNYKSKHKMNIEYEIIKQYQNQGKVKIYGRENI